MNWCKQGTLENSDKRDSAVWESQGSQVNGANFQRPVAMQDRWKTRGSDRSLTKNFEFEPLGETSQGSRENTSLDGSFRQTRKELEMTLKRDVLPATLLEFPTVRQMTLAMNNLMLVPSLQAREVVGRKQEVSTKGWDPLFIGYSAAAYFHSSEIEINSWSNEAKKIRGSMPPRCDVRELNKVLERAGFENKDPIYDDGRIIVEEGHLGLKAESYGLEEVEVQHE